MNKTRIAAKCFATTVVTTVLVIGSLSAPAQAKDTGWGIVKDDSAQSTARDTGWG